MAAMLPRQWGKGECFRTLPRRRRAPPLLREYVGNLGRIAEIGQ